MLFGIEEQAFEEVLAGMMVREARDPISVGVRSSAGRVEALTWPMSSAWERLTPDQLAAAAVENIRAGGGPSGDAGAYVSGIMTVLTSIGEVDPLTEAYAAALRARRPTPYPR